MWRWLLVMASMWPRLLMIFPETVFRAADNARWHSIWDAGLLETARPLPERVIAPHLLHAIASFALLLSCTDPHRITLHDS
jgi:hypothetical protein